MCATIWPPDDVTCTTVEAASETKPESGTTFCVFGATTIPVVPGALTVPLLSKIARSTVAFTSVGFDSVTRLVRPVSVEPPTSQVDWLGSSHEAAPAPTRSPFETLWKLLPATCGVVSPAGAVSSRGSLPPVVEESSEDRSTVEPVVAVATVAVPTVLACVASLPASSDRRRALPAQTRSAAAGTGVTVRPAGRPGSESVP